MSMESQSNDGKFAVNVSTEILTVPRAALLLDCNERILSERLRNGEIRGYKQGNRWYILHDDLMAWIRAGEVNVNGKRKAKI